MHWYAVYTGIRAERRACAAISALGVTTYFPVRDKVVTHARRRRVVKSPLLSRYLFAQFDVRGDWGGILRADGVEAVLSSYRENDDGDVVATPVAVPARQMARIMAWEEHPEIIAAAKAGDVMRVIGGAFEGHSATLTEVWPEKFRARGAVNLFGRQTPVEFDLEQLEKSVS